MNYIKLHNLHNIYHIKLQISMFDFYIFLPCGRLQTLPGFLALAALHHVTLGSCRSALVSQRGWQGQRANTLEITKVI